MTELYYTTIKEASKLPEAYCREHFPARMERAARFRFEEDRLRSIGAGALLAKVLFIREADLKTGPRGKLFVPGAEKHFNLSHSGEYIVLAVSDGEAGVDIEQQDRRHLDIAKRVFRPEELVWMNAHTNENSMSPGKSTDAGADEPPAGSAEAEQIRRFFRLWTLKESVMKQTGLGLSLPPESFNVLPLLQGNGIELEAGGRKRTLYAESTELPAPEDGSAELLRRSPAGTASDGTAGDGMPFSYSLAVCTEQPEKVNLCPVSQLCP